MLPCVRLGTRGVWRETRMAIQPCAIISTLRLQASLEVLAGRLKEKKVAMPPCGSDGGTRCGTADLRWCSGPAPDVTVQDLVPTVIP